MATFISLLWPLLFKFLIGPLYWQGGIIIPIISMSYVFYGLFILQMPSIYLKNKENWAPVFWGSGLLVNLICNYFLIIYIGYYGAACSTLLSYMTMAFFLYYKNRKWMPINYNYNLNVKPDELEIEENRKNHQEREKGNNLQRSRN